MRSAPATFGLAAALFATAPDAHSAPVRDTGSDIRAITATALDFEEGWYTGDKSRMSRALHPNFVMRHVGADPGTGHSVLDQDIGRAELLARTAAGRGKVPPERQRHDVTVLDVFQNAAAAKIIAWYGVDYLQLAKWDGQWVIVSVLWSRNPAPAPLSRGPTKVD
jgi:hypothetical protein